MDCPVCKRKEINTQICPQCETDLSSLWILQNSSVGFYNKGLQFAKDGKFDDAIKLLMTAQTINPDDVEIYTLLGKSFFNTKKYSESKKYWLHVLEKDPHNEVAKEAINEIDSASRRRTFTKFLISSILIILVVVGLVYLYRTLNQYQKLMQNLDSKSSQIKALQIQLESLSDSMKHSMRSTFTYRIKKGDSFWNIARRFYGNPEMYNLILENNPSLRNKQNQLKIGSTIIIPIPRNGKGILSP